MSLDFNLSILGGRLVEDPKTIGDGKGARFSMASNRRYRDKEGELQKDTTYMSVTCWSRLAGLVLKNCRKGDVILVEGRLETRKVGTDDGNRTYTNIVARDVRFMNYRDEPEEPVDGVPSEAADLIRGLIGS